MRPVRKVFRQNRDAVKSRSALSGSRLHGRIRKNSPQKVGGFIRSAKENIILRMHQDETTSQRRTKIRDKSHKTRPGGKIRV